MTAVDPWAELRGQSVPIHERCGAPTKRGRPCQIERALCGFHPRKRPFRYGSEKPLTDYFREHPEAAQAFGCDSSPGITAARGFSGPQSPRNSAPRPSARKSTRGREGQAPGSTRGTADDEDAGPYRYRSERLRHLNPGGSGPAERTWDGPPDSPPDGGGEPLPRAV